MQQQFVNNIVQDICKGKFVVATWLQSFFLFVRTEAMYIAHEKNLQHNEKNTMISKSISDGLEAEVFEEMPIEAKEFLIKFHNGVDEKKDIMQQLKLVTKVSQLIWISF